MPRVSVHLDNVPAGAPVTVAGLGTFENGSDNEVDEKTWKRFKAAYPNSSRLSNDTLTVGKPRSVATQQQQPVVQQPEAQTQDSEQEDS